MGLRGFARALFLRSESPFTYIIAINTIIVVVIIIMVIITIYVIILTVILVMIIINMIALTIVIIASIIAVIYYSGLHPAIGSHPGEGSIIKIILTTILHCDD